MQRTPGERKLLAAFALGHLANDWAVGAIWLVAPAMALAFGLGPAEVGLLITVYGVGAAVAYVPAGLLADRRSRVGGLLVATFWWVAIGHVVASVMPGYWSFVALMALAVMGDAAWHPIATGYLVRRFPGQRARVLGIHAMGGTVGAEVLAPLAVGAVLSVADWRAALQVAALPAVLMGAAFVVVSRRLAAVPVTTGHGLDLRGLLAPWTRGAGLRLAATMVFYNMAIIALLSMLPLYLATELDLAPMSIAMLFAGTLMAGSLAQPWAGTLSDRHGRRPLLRWGMMAGGGGALVAGAGVSPVATVATLCAAVVVLTAIRSVFLAAAVDVARGRESATLALAFTILDGVGALGALFAGLAGGVELTRAFALAGALALAALVTLELTRRGTVRTGEAVV